MIENGNGNGMVMPVSPMYGGGGMGGMGFGGDWFAWLILLLIIGGNGWGNGFGGNGGNGGLFPWLNMSESTLNGFQNIATQLCNGFAAIQQSMASNQMATMQQMFAGQTANMQGFNQVGLQMCNGFNATNNNIADLKYTVATENCQDRAAAAQNTYNIIDNQNRGYQGIMDKLCQLELDGVKAQLTAKDDIIAQLRQENLYARGQASQIAQNEQIVDSIYNRLANCPVSTTPVYGRTPIFTCSQNPNIGGCPCNGNSFYN